MDLKRILVYDDESCTLYGATVDMRTLEVRSNYEVRNLVTLLHDARHQPGLNTCPPWLFEWLKAYPERCRRGLSLLWGLEEGRQLCETHPLLALCCVEKMVRAQLDRDAACTLWRMKRRDLVRWCFQHVPSDLAKRALKILSRVEFSLQENTVARAAGMTPSFDTVLRDARTVHALSHWPHTQIGWWSLLASELRGRHGRGVACFNHSPLFRHLGQREQPVDLTRVMRLWNDTRELGRVLGVDVGVHLAGCRTVDGLHRLHDLWTEEFNRGGPAEADGTPSFHRVPPVVFPDPPVPETTYIQAIRTSHALRREGYEMRHCVGSYQRRIMAGGTFVYRVLQPHRATLQLARSEAGEWRVAALLGRRNRPVPQESHERVRQWLTLETEKRAQAAAELEAQARRESMQRQRRVEVRMISGAPSGEQGSQTGGRFEVSLGEIELASLQRRGNPVLPFAAPPVPERTPALDPEPEPVRRPQLSVWDVGFLVVMVCAAAEVFSRVL